MVPDFYSLVETIYNHSGQSSTILNICMYAVEGRWLETNGFPILTLTLVAMVLTIWLCQSNHILVYGCFNGALKSVLWWGECECDRVI